MATTKVWDLRNSYPVRLLTLDRRYSIPKVRYSRYSTRTWIVVSEMDDRRNYSQS